MCFHEHTQELLPTFKLMRDDVDKVLATQDSEAIRAKLTEVQGVQVKLNSFYKREIKKSLQHTQRRSFAGELYKALTQQSALSNST